MAEPGTRVPGADRGRPRQNRPQDLKITISQVAVLILVILFLEQAVEIGATIETLYLGSAIGIVVLASVFAWKNMKH